MKTSLPSTSIRSTAHNTQSAFPVLARLPHTVLLLLCRTCGSLYTCTNWSACLQQHIKCGQTITSSNRKAPVMPIRVTNLLAAVTLLVLCLVVLYSLVVERSHLSSFLYQHDEGLGTKTKTNTTTNHSKHVTADVDLPLRPLNFIHMYVLHVGLFVLYIRKRQDF